MKKLVFSTWLLLPAGAWAQQAPPVATPAAATPVVAATPETPALDFCGQNYPITSGCTLQSKYQLQCADYQLTWMYLDYGMLKTFPEQFVRQIEKQHKGAERQPLDCFILQKPAKGFLVTYPKPAGGMAYELIAYGVANQQPVMLQLTLENTPEKTADLPAVPRQLVQLTK